ncbi:hypothetical protein DY000_02038324 [Brassica cretica]|uniref:SWIM-type domain-containing protein n=1 Tax=Brassica cretica TaxID=69181 RepID=A0ABQ7BF01_BRACR|nr:hypothetical protein DY000_02038324 [Brassica cretica]
MPTDASTSEEKERNPCDIWAASSIVKGAKHSEKTKGKMKQSEVDGDDCDVDKHDEKKKGKMKQDEVDGDDYDAANINSEKENREKLAKSPLVELVKTGYLFLNKTVLKARFELCAMKHNFHYTVTNSDKSVWCIRCADKMCFWGARVECLKGSTYFIIKKYVGVHSCAPSSKTSAGKTTSAKTIGGLIMHKYEGIKEGPKAKDIVQIMRNDYGCEISDSLAWDSPIGNYLMEADVKKWARCQFHGYMYDIRINNPAESINSALRSPREFPHTHRLTIDVEEKIDRRIEKGKTFRVYPVTDSKLLVKGDTIDCFVDLYKRTCSCGKYDLLKIPCRHAIKVGFFVGREPYTSTDFLYTTGAWREAYQESINPIAVPEDGWSVPQVVENSEVLPPETRRSLGRNRKRRYETVEDKIRSSQGSQGAWREAYQESINPIAVPEDGWSVPQVVENSEVLPPETRRSLGRNRKRRYETVEDKIRSSQRSQGGQLRKCSRCGLGGHNRATCKMRI